MEYHISETEFNEIQAELPSGFVFAFQDSDGHFVHSSELVPKWPSIDMDVVINSLYGKTYSDFLAEKYTSMQSLSLIHI